MRPERIFACDIDNTVSDQFQRYKDFFNSETQTILPQAFEKNEIIKDRPIYGAVEAITSLSKKYRIFWVSARPLEHYDITYQWLTKHKFYIDDLLLVEKHNNKIKVLFQMKPHVYIDDLKYGWEILQPKLKTNFIKRLHDVSVNFEIFDNNWEQILGKYLK
jgi:uncharacterized HAD superfamily protein